MVSRVRRSTVPRAFDGIWAAGVGTAGACPGWVAWLEGGSGTGPGDQCHAASWCQASAPGPVTGSQDPVNVAPRSGDGLAEVDTALTRLEALYERDEAPGWDDVWEAVEALRRLLETRGVTL